MDRPIVSLNSTLAPLEIGNMISLYLFGVASVQTYIYFYNQKGPRVDRLTLRLEVALLWLLELAQTVCYAHSVYSLTISDFGSLNFLSGTVPSTMYISFCFSGLIGPLVQYLYARRIRKFAGNWYLTFFCYFLSAMQVVGTVALTVRSLQLGNLIRLEETDSWLLTAILVVDASTDIIIAAALCYYIRRERRSVLKRTARLLDVLMVWTMQTGLLTSVTVLVQLVIFMTMKARFGIWMALFSAVAKFYSNSLLASLNLRSKLRTMTTSTAITVSGSELRDSFNNRVMPQSIIIAQPTPQASLELGLRRTCSSSTQYASPTSQLKSESEQEELPPPPHAV